MPPPPAVEYDPKAWQEFTSAEGRFAVLLPGRPTEAVRSADSPIGKLDIHMCTLRTFAQYGVTYIEYPKSVEDGGRVDDFLAGVRDGGVKGVNGTLAEEKEVSLDGHPGRCLEGSQCQPIKGLTVDGRETTATVVEGRVLSKPQHI